MILIESLPQHWPDFVSGIGRATGSFQLFLSNMQTLSDAYGNDLTAKANHAPGQAADELLRIVKPSS